MTERKSWDELTEIYETQGYAGMSDEDIERYAAVKGGITQMQSDIETKQAELEQLRAENLAKALVAQGVAESELESVLARAKAEFGV